METIRPKRLKYTVHCIVRDLESNKILHEMSISYNDYNKVFPVGSISTINSIPYRILDKLHVPGCIHLKVEPINIK